MKQRTNETKRIMAQTTLDGLMFTTKNLIRLTNYLLQHGHLKVCLRTCSQDVLEAFFGNIVSRPNFYWSNLWSTETHWSARMLTQFGKCYIYIIAVFPVTMQMFVKFLQTGTSTLLFFLKYCHLQFFLSFLKYKLLAYRPTCRVDFLLSIILAYASTNFFLHLFWPSPADE